MIATLPSQEILNELLAYDPDTGRLEWRQRPRAYFSCNRLWKTWNTSYAGKEAFTAINQGYRVGNLLGSTRAAHRVIWKMVTGDEPPEIDHDNGVRSDNRFENLIPSDRVSNGRNLRLKSNNTSGFNGVRKRRSGDWLAYIKVDGRHLHLGVFATAEAAVAARRQADVQHGFSRRHGSGS